MTGAYQWLVFGPAHRLIELGPAWFDVHLPMVLIGCTSVVSTILMHVGWLVIVMYVLKSHHVIVARPGAQGGEELARLLNTIARVGLAVALLLVALETVREALRLMERTGFWSRWSPRQG